MRTLYDDDAETFNELFQHKLEQLGFTIVHTAAGAVLLLVENENTAIYDDPSHNNKINIGTFILPDNNKPETVFQKRKVVARFIRRDDVRAQQRLSDILWDDCFQQTVENIALLSGDIFSTQSTLTSTDEALDMLKAYRKENMNSSLSGMTEQAINKRLLPFFLVDADRDIVEIAVKSGLYANSVLVLLMLNNVVDRETVKRYAGAPQEWLNEVFLPEKLNSTLEALCRKNARTLPAQAS